MRGRSKHDVSPPFSESRTLHRDWSAYKTVARGAIHNEMQKQLRVRNWRGARFEGGARAPAPTDQELNAMAAKASTPADHHGLEEYFLASAKRYTAEGKEHAAMAAAYRGTSIAQAAVHC